jgi:CDP-6-deoxy-D-xylo-4-hexulose-3-dehydrase
MSSKRESILKLTREFAEEVLTSQKFVAGETPVPVSGKVLSSEDFVSLVDSSLDGWLTAGKHTKLFEHQLAEFVGARSALFVNSGSSANLCALSGLTSPKLGNRALKMGDEVLTVAMGFPTTVNPIIQNGLKPVVVDVEIQLFKMV